VSELTVNGHRVHYELEGAANAPVVVTSNSLGTSLAMWDEQVPALTRQFRVLRYDTRGHGNSEVTPGDYQIEQLGMDVLALTSALRIDEFSFCGLSMGGVIGQWLALHGAQRLNRLILCNTAPKIGDADGWNARITMARRDGLVEIAAGAIARWFTPTFVASDPARVETIRQQLLACDASGYAANCAAVRDADFRNSLGDIHVPTLVIAGAEDPVTTLADGQALAAAIPGATLAVMNAAHLSNIGDLLNFNAAVTNFLSTRD
jgi:3-oxoadipate enol-lactonase